MRTTTFFILVVSCLFVLGSDSYATVDHRDLVEGDCISCHAGHVRAFSGQAGEKAANHQGLSCLTCHDFHSNPANLSFVPEQIETPNSGTRSVVFTARTGPDSFADGDAVYDGVCEVCHTMTGYHRNDGSVSQAHNTATDCTACHPHEEGFSPVGGSCLDCHSIPRGSGGYRRQIVENSGDGGGDFVLTSHHVTDGTQNELVTAGDCIVCHDQGNHMSYGDGVSVYLRDPNGGASIVYDGTPQSVETWCLACHDGTHTSPFSDGQPAPDLSTWDGSAHGATSATCLDCHDNGHGSGNLHMVATTIATPNSGNLPVNFSSLTGPGSFADGDAVYDGVCEVCHTGTAFHRNDPSGDHSHFVAQDCTACHGHDVGFQPTAGSCTQCHNSEQGPGGYRRQVVSGVGGNGEFVLLSHHVSDGTQNQIVQDSDCVVCHDQTNHMTYSDGVSVLLVDLSTGSPVLYNGTPATLEPFCLGCHDGTQTAPFSDGNPAPDMSGWNGASHSPAGSTCAQCHTNGHGTDNLALIGTQIETPNNGVLPVVFTSWTGPNSMADGDGIYDGICEVCHTATTYHRNNASGNHGHNSGNDCRACHDHNTGFSPQAGSCLACHNTTQGSGGYRRQVVENNNDGGGDFVRVSHHVSDGSTTEIVTEGDCVVCHNQSQHMTFTDGVSVLLEDPAGGPTITYDGSTGSITGFCAACHDGTPASPPFSDGNTPPNVLATWPSSAHGTANNAPCGECHTNGHGGDNQQMLTARYDRQDYLNYSSARYALCWQCHNENTIVFGNNSFEDLHDKHVVGEDSACVLCHQPHGPFDDGEAGNIDFSYGLDNGFDIQLIDGYTRSTAFWTSGNTGFCYIACHGKDHTPKDYRRDLVLQARDLSGQVEGVGPFVSARSYPVPSRGPVTIVLQQGEKADKAQVSEWVEVTIYDISGRRIRDLSFDHGGADDATLFWDGLDAAGHSVQSGVYFCRVSTRESSRTLKMVIVR